jgi:hypothetical protein
MTTTRRCSDLLVIFNLLNLNSDQPVPLLALLLQLHPELCHAANTFSLCNGCEPESHLYIQLPSSALSYYFSEQRCLSVRRSDFTFLKTEPHLFHYFSKKFLVLPEIVFCKMISLRVVGISLFCS